MDESTGEQQTLPVAAASVTTPPDPTLPDPTLPDPALPDPALPDPTQSDPTLSDPTLSDPAAHVPAPPAAPVLLATAPPRPSPAPPGRVFVPRWLAVLVSLVLVAAIGFAIGYAVTPDDSSQSSAAPAAPTTPTTPTTPAPSTPAPSTTPPPSGTDPSASALRDLGLRQQDLPTSSSISLGLIPGGNRVAAAPTLDLCNGTFPSESQRTARLQLAAADAQGNATLSTESVLYSDATATQQAFAELRATADKCPDSPVPSPVGEPTETTKFNHAPDGSWPQVAGVDRLAYDFVTTDQSGQSQHSVAVYLRRGRALMGIYFPQPDSTQLDIAGQTTIRGIVNVFANRMAQLPDSVVSR